MPSELPQCRNTHYKHTIEHPSYAISYDGYCLDCSNAGVPELAAVLAARDAELTRLRKVAATARKYLPKCAGHARKCTWFNRPPECSCGYGPFVEALALLPPTPKEG